MNLRWAPGSTLRVLHLDIENRPLSYLGMDYTTAEVTAIAAGWLDEPEVHCWALGEVSADEMLRGFRFLYDQAAIVTGHYVLRHDLPILNGAFMEAGLPTLGSKLVSDTKQHLVKRKDLSASQESLAGMYGLSEGKEGMSQPQWREANRLTPAGIRETKRRVIGDVRQHRALRAKLIEVGALHGPKPWRP